MNLTVEIAGSIMCSFFVLVAAYGAVKQNKELLFFGICFHSTLPIIGEAMAYAKDDEILHVVVAMMFLLLVILTLPTRLDNDKNNKAAKALSNRIVCAIMVTNLFAGYLVLINILHVSNHFGYIHFSVSLIMIYYIIKLEKT